MLTARRVLEELRAHRVTHVIGLPDNSTAALFAVLQERNEITVVSVTREGEAFAIAAGLWMGGAVPVVLIQNTGFFESGDALRGCVSRLRIPLVCLIGYRGYRKLKAAGLEPSVDLLTPDNLSRPEQDSCALLFEPTLRAWGVPYELLANDDELPRLAAAFERAERDQSAVAVLIVDDMM